jgi:Mrp family chromosome partitioning ATPase
MSRLAVLAEIGVPTSSNGRAWGLRRSDLEQLAAVRDKVGGRRVVLVTGAEAVAPIVAVALAGAAAAAGTPTALVECDVERPRLAAGLGLAPGPGLHEYLRWEATPADVVQPLILAGPVASPEAGALACVVAGRPGTAPRALLGLGSFRHMTAKLREAYELVVLLGPPLEGAGGALDTAAEQADCSIAALVERPNRRAAKANHEALSWLNAPPLGAVVVTN